MGLEDYYPDSMGELVSHAIKKFDGSDSLRVLKAIASPKKEDIAEALRGDCSGVAKLNNLSLIINNSFLLLKSVLPDRIQELLYTRGHVPAPRIIIPPTYRFVEIPKIKGNFGSEAFNLEDHLNDCLEADIDPVRVRVITCPIGIDFIPLAPLGIYKLARTSWVKSRAKQHYYKSKLAENGMSMPLPFNPLYSHEELEEIRNHSNT